MLAPSLSALLYPTTTTTGQRVSSRPGEQASAGGQSPVGTRGEQAEGVPAATAQEWSVQGCERY